MFEAVTLGLMLHSHHFESPKVDANAELTEYFKEYCHEHGGCVDSGEKFVYANRTPGIYAIADGWTAAAFRNSYGKLSVFAGYTFERQTTYGGFGLTVGATTGYQYRTYSWVHDTIRYQYRSGFSNAVLLPTAMFSYSTPKLFDTDARLRLMYTPKKNVLTLGVEKQF